MNRRYFLMGSLAAPAVQTARAQASTLGVGMIGVGNRGAHVMKSVLEQPSVRVAALCDIKPDRLDRAASGASRDNPKTYREWRELVADSNVDVVHISTPCDLHVEMAIAALKAGKHVYCEKPAGVTAASIGELVRVARATNKVFVIGQQMRSGKRLQQTIARIQDGLIGKIVMIKAQRHAGDDLSHDGLSADWFFDARRSGDVIVEMSVHNLDVCNWVAGSRPERAAGFGGALVWPNDPPGRTNMDGYTLSYEYANGIKMSYTQVFFHWNGMPGNGQYFYVYGAEGAVDLSNSMYYKRGRGNKPEELVPEGPRENLDMLHVAALFDAIRNGTRPPAGIEEAATGALTAILGRDAIYQKKMLTWSDLGVQL